MKEIINSYNKVMVPMEPDPGGKSRSEQKDRNNGHCQKDSRVTDVKKYCGFEDIRSY